MADHSLNLTELIGAIRTELEEADQALRARQKPVLFELSGLELELSFTVSSSDQVKGGFDLKVVALGSKIDSASQEVQRIKLKFNVPRNLDPGTLGGRFDREPAPRARDKSVKPL